MVRIVIFICKMIVLNATQALPGTLWNTIPQPELLLKSGLSKDTPIPAPGLVGKHGLSTGLRTVRLGHELVEFS